VSGYIDIPSRAVRYLGLQCPTAPTDPDMYSSLSVCLEREMGLSIVEDGWWRVVVEGSWSTPQGELSVAVELPLAQLLSDEYAIMHEAMNPLW
jgi:hypothetical protein